MHRKGGSSIVKVPVNVPLARVYILFWISSLANGMLFGKLVTEVSNLRNSSKETQIFCDCDPANVKIWQVLSRKRQIMALLM